MGDTRILVVCVCAHLVCVCAHFTISTATNRGQHFMQCCPLLVAVETSFWVYIIFVWRVIWMNLVKFQVNLLWPHHRWGTLGFSLCVCVPVSVHTFLSQLYLRNGSTDFNYNLVQWFIGASRCAFWVSQTFCSTEMLLAQRSARMGT